jgi:hypothetical protein
MQDETYAVGGELAAALVAAQRESNLAPSVAQAAYLAFSQAQLHLSTGRGHTGDAHKVLEKIARVFNIDIAMDDPMFGDGIKYPSAIAAEPRAAA